MARRTQTLIAALVLCAAVVAAGCGGAGGTDGTDGMARATVRGSVRSTTPAALPPYTVRSGGATAAVQADGGFVLEGVATGQRVVEVLNAAGQIAAAASVNIIGDTTIEPFDLGPSGGSSGIRGIVLRGPIHPTSQPGVPNDEPVPGATLDLTTADSATVLQRIVGDADGRFAVDVEPGAYRLVPIIPNAGLFPRGEPVDVKVYEGQVTEVQLVYDTGIR